MVLAALAAMAGSALVQAMVTDGWEGVRHKVARLFGRGQPDPAIERRFDATRGQLAGTSPADLESAKVALTAQWQTRFEDLLADHPDAEADLAALVEELKPVIASAAGHSVAAARDVNVSADHGSVAAGVIEGGVHMGPYQAGSGVQLTGSGVAGQFGPGAAIAYGGPAIGSYVQPRRDEPARLPVSLPPRPAELAGREDLLRRLHGLVTEGGGVQTVVLCGLGGVGKTSMAAEYAHRHLAEVAVAWQVHAEEPTVLTQDVAELAAQLGGRDLADLRDPVASVHAVLAAHPSDWLVIFDNAPDDASVRRFAGFWPRPGAAG